MKWTYSKIIQAPMAGAAGADLAIAATLGGALGSIACPMLSKDQIKLEVKKFRDACGKAPLNLNFFCHEDKPLTENDNKKWLSVLKPYYDEFKIDISKPTSPATRKPFDEEMCTLMEELKPEVISFHFGLPKKDLLTRIKKLGCKIISSATTLEEALWLEEKGCDAIIAQGVEAGGHRAMFLTEDLGTQIKTMDLVRAIARKAKVPVIAAGGISNAQKIKEAFALGASAVQIGTAYLYTNEATITKIHQKILLSEKAKDTALTNLFSGKPARGVMNRLMKEIGPISKDAPPFPHAGSALAPLKLAAEKQNSGDFSSLWSGQSKTQRKEIIPAKELTEQLLKESK